MIYMTPDSLRDESNPWVASRERISNEWNPHGADALFLAGMDWQAVPENCDRPVINLIQGLRHARPEDPRHAFFRRAATRVCVSEQVADAILSTGLVNGQVLTIPAGVDTATFPAPAPQRDIPLLIAGLKQPALAIELSQFFSAQGVECVCLTQQIPRSEFLGMLGRARVTLFLPLRQEGFYLPALEGMAMGTLVVCPDCVGNRGFCVNGSNCLMPDYTIEALGSAGLAAIESSPTNFQLMQKNACHQVQAHTLEAERRSYLDLLESLASAGS
jgi:hypothetical protein